MITYPITDYTFIISINNILDSLSIIIITINIWIFSIILIARNSIKAKNIKPHLFELTTTLLPLRLIICFSSSNLYIYILYLIWSIPSANITSNYYLRPTARTKKARFFIIIYTYYSFVATINNNYKNITYKSSYLYISPNKLLYPIYKPIYCMSYTNNSI